MNLVLESLKIMLIGMGTVFFILFLFYCIVKGLQALFPYSEKEENPSTK